MPKKKIKKPRLTQKQTVALTDRLHADKIRFLPIRATPHNRNNVDMEKHFQQFLRSEKQLKPPSRSHSRNS